MDAPALHRQTHAPRAGVSQVAVVKLGGSVIRSPELPAWLDVIAEARAPIVIVPGGGALADEVRSCQRQLGFGNAAAHRMALLAMDQLAWAVAGLRPGFAVGATESALLEALDQSLVAVWAPYALISGRTDIEETWRLTSDSLALWLAGRIGAGCCCLIKSIARHLAPRTAADLARSGIVDGAFPSLLAETGVAAALFGRGDQQALAACLTTGTSAGCRIA